MYVIASKQKINQFEATHHNLKTKLNMIHLNYNKLVQFSNTI